MVVEKKKYIIELPENTHWVQWILESTEDHHPYMDFRQVEALTLYTEPDLEQIRKEAYDEGYADAKGGYENGFENGMIVAWEAARKISMSKIDGGLSWEAMNDIFGTAGSSKIYKKFTAPEAIEKIRQYEQEKEEIKVGDEVISPNGKGVVTEITDIYVRIMYAKGSGQVVKSEDLTKTGRHFPEIAEVLQKMKESDNG